MRKYIFHKVNVIAIMVLFSFEAHAQELFTNVIDSSINQYIGYSYLAIHSLTLTQGFTFTASQGAAFHVYIDGNEPMPIDATIPQNNIIRTDIIKIPGVHSDNDILALTTAANQIQTQYSYMDGMGRPIQSVQSQASPLGMDMVQLTAYDNLGRSSKQYLPYTSTTTTGAYQTNAVATQATFYNSANQKISTDASPFALTNYDSSSLDRVLEQSTAGSDWQIGTGHTVRRTYRLNTANEVANWGSAGAAGYYGVNVLEVMETLDENGNKTTVFKNQMGQLVLKRVAFNQNITENGVTTFIANLDTYFVYDDLGRVIYMVPPKAAGKIAAGAIWNASFISQWVFHYIYDANGRLIEKDVPGSAPTYMVYNQMDQLVMSQDGKLGGTGRWYFIKYDQAQRPVMSGIYTYANPYPGDTGTPQAELQKLYNSFNYDGADKYYEERSSTGTHAYTNQSFPTSGEDIETVNYYDTYDIYGSGTGAANFTYQPQGFTNENTAAVNCNGVLSSTKLKVVGSNNRWLVKVNFYDKYGRTIQQCKNNHIIALDNTPNPATLLDVATNVFNFDNTLALIKVYKTIAAGNTITVTNKFSYDRWQRLASVTQSNNGSVDQVVGRYAYNEIGQLVDRSLHQKTDGSFLQSVDYRYNIRGWLSSINSADLTHNVNTGDAPDLFGMEFSYDVAETGFIDGATYKNYYNGEIAAVKWKVASDATTTRPERSYRYTYDPANRLRQSYSAALGGTSWTAELGGYNENADYDQNGNILHLDRNTVYNGAVFTMDNLTYNYTANGTTYGNQLQKVDDAVANTTGLTEFKDNVNLAIEYTYDADGNLLTDANKGSAAVPVTYTYNDINKTSKVDFGSGNYVSYTYDAAGNRLQRLVYTANQLTNTYDYLDGLIYKNNTLVSFPMPEGRVTVAAGVFQYEYVVKDNQGNSRVSFIMGTNGTAQLTQENHYYPFGMTMSGPTTNMVSGSSPNQFLYNAGSELQQDNGSNIYSTFFREYDPAIARFSAVDIDAGSNGETSPYVFATDNPILYNDPLGNDPYGPGRVTPGYDVFEDPFDQWEAIANSHFTTPQEVEFYANQTRVQNFLDWSNNQTIISQLTQLGFVSNPDGTYSSNYHTITQIYQDKVYDVVPIPGPGSNEFQVIFPTDDNNLWRKNGFVRVSEADADRFLGISPDANQGGAGDISTGISTGLFLTSSTFSLLNENATRNINAIKETNSWWTKMTGKLPGSAARDLEAETFTKTATDMIGKRIFVAGVVYSAYSIYEDHSAGNIAINVLDNLVGAAGIWIPGAQIPALIYFGGRFAYDLYKANNQ